MRNRIEALLLAIVLVFVPCIRSDAQDDILDIPVEVQQACEKYGELYGICPELLETMAYYESRYIPTVENGSCKGLLQINTKWHKDRMKKLGVTDIYDIDSNVLVAADYLAELFDQYEDIGIVLGVYHGEKDAVKRAKNNNLSSYTTLIIDKSAELERAHQK